MKLPPSNTSRVRKLPRDLFPHLDARVDARLSALPSSGKLKAALPGRFSRRIRRNPGQLDTNSHAGEQPEPVSPPAPAVMTVTPAPVKSLPTTKRPAAEPSRQSNGASRPAGTTVPLIKPKAAAAATATSTASSLPCLRQLQAGQNRTRSSQRNRTGHAAGRHERGFWRHRGHAGV